MISTRRSRRLIGGGALIAVVLGMGTLACTDDPPLSDGPDDSSASTTSTTEAPTTTDVTVADTTTTTPGDEPATTSPDADTVISFAAIGAHRLDDEAPRPTGDEFDDGKCGFWEPADSLWAMVTQRPDGSIRIAEIKVADPAYRTASGVGVGSELATIQSVYGDRLVIDRADGWDAPTDGLLALYNDVAAVREGSAALTFVLGNDAVTQIELSPAGNWGDDEGCV